MTKNIKRDEKGHAILDGAITFGNKISIKSKRYNSTDLKNQAAERITEMMESCAVIKKLEMLSEQQKEFLNFQKEYAESSKIVQFAYHNDKYKQLMEELKELLECNNKRKVELKRATIERQIKEEEGWLREIYREIKNERVVVSRTRSE